MADEAQKSSLPGRYATAIFDLAVDMNLLDTVASDVRRHVDISSVVLKELAPERQHAKAAKSRRAP